MTGVQLFPCLSQHRAHGRPWGVYGLWGRHPFCLHVSRSSCVSTVCDHEWMSLDSSLGVPSPSRMASCSSRSPRGDSRDSERKRPLGRVGRGIPQLPFSSTWKWVISANSPTFSCSSSTSARSFCCSSTVDKEEVSTLEGKRAPREPAGRGSQPRGSLRDYRPGLRRVAGLHFDFWHV